ncbi:MAG: cytochrome c oxidase assembly protein [Actinomycetia bacterium]|nr:cytochrome c oxidase assembly protein [Actinomycetes bacterium]
MLQTAVVLLAALAYALAVVRLRRRGRRVSALRVTAFAAGIALLLVAFLSPLDHLGEERLFSAHMAQHLLIGDIAPLLVVLGLDGPLLRPLLAVRPVQRLRWLAHPLVALPLWAVKLCIWHVTPLYNAALDHDAVHAVQHGLFFGCGALVWAALLEPLPGPAWFTAGRKLVYVAGMWLVSLALSQVFLWSGNAYYARYVDAPRTWGLTAIADQRAGGGVMLVEGSLVMLGVAVWLLFRVFRESESRQRLLDAGVEPGAAARAARYGR